MKTLNWRWPTKYGTLPTSIVVGILLAISALLVAAPAAEINPLKVLGSVGQLLEFLGFMLIAPDWAYLPDLLAKMLETIEIGFLSTFMALVASLPLGVLAASNTSPHPLVYHFTRNLMNLMRALPEFMWALVFVSAVGLGPLPGVMALAFVTTGFMSKFFAESIEVIDPKAVEGVKSTGAQQFHILMFAVLPQALPDFISTTLYILDNNIRSATVLGLVGAGGIGYDMVMAMRLFNYSRLIMIAVCIFIAVTIFDRLSDKFRSWVI
jgi:phosphonate transport system permease protein